MSSDLRNSKTKRSHPGPGRVTSANLRDVAAHAKVSVATASRVFAENSNVRESTKARVLASADELGYVVNGLARAMTGKGTQSIAFLVRDMIGPTFASMAAGVDSVARKSGHLVLMTATEGDSDREAELIKILREMRIKAVLMVGSTESGEHFEDRVAAYQHDLSKVNAQLVLCGRPPITRYPELISVNYDQLRGVGAAVDELVRLGHSEIAYIGRNDGMTTQEMRQEGFEQAIKRHGLPAKANLVRPSINTVDDGARAALELFETEPQVTGIVTMTDNIAIGVYRAAREYGLRIPEQVSIIGFDDMPLVEDLTPSLSSIRAPFFDIGVKATEIAMGFAPKDHVLLPTTLVRRGSAAAIKK